MTGIDAEKLYDAHYYSTGCGRPYARDEIWMAFFGGVAERIVAGIAPQTLLDAGCALGLLVEQLRQRGVDAEGIDISEYAIASAPEAVKPYVRQGSVADPFGKRYDLIVCIEVLEHMPPETAEAALANFCEHSDDILFSSSPLDFKEATHFNVRPIEYWAELFARRGFYRDVDFDAGFITPWAARFRRRNDPPARIVRDYERRFWELWKANSDLRELAVEQRAQLAATTPPPAAAATPNPDAAYVAQLEAQLALKNAHIARLEHLLQRIEHGRLMRILRWLKRSP